MIRTVITPDNKVFPLSIPDNYIGRQVEVIVFALDEAHENITSGYKRTFEAAKLKTKGFKFNRDEANER